MIKHILKSTFKYSIHIHIEIHSCHITMTTSFDELLHQHKFPQNGIIFNLPGRDPNEEHITQNRHRNDVHSTVAGRIRLKKNSHSSSPTRLHVSEDTSYIRRKFPRGAHHTTGEYRTEFREEYKYKGKSYWVISKPVQFHNHPDYEIIADRAIRNLRWFLRSSMGGMERMKGERIELQSDRAEKHDQNRLNLGRFDVEKM